MPARLPLFLKLLAALLGVLAIVGALVGTKLEQFRSMAEAGAAMVPPPEIVTSATAAADEWETTLASTGTLEPVQGVTISAERPGKITKIAFESGTTVQAGAVLVQLETATEEADLRAAKAASVLAKSNLDRIRELRRSNNSSAADLDAAEARYEEAEAQVQSTRTTIAKKTVRAPFAGRLGIRQVNLGQVLEGGEAITSLQSLDPIYVNFSLPQQRLPLLALGTTVRVITDAAPGETFLGAISAISPEVDPATRNVRVQATVDNRGEKLRGGMFAGVEVVLPAREQVLAIPLTAVLFAPFGDSVFVIERAEAPAGGAAESPAEGPAEGPEEGLADGLAEGVQPPLVITQRFVRLGTQRGDFVAVKKGLTDGEQVVSSGVFKLRSGMSVVVENTLAPDAQLAPTPKNL